MVYKKYSSASTKEILKALNAVLLDFPLYRLEFLQMLSTKYRLFLLAIQMQSILQNLRAPQASLLQ
jgi:hypothetical protein